MPSWLVITRKWLRQKIDQMEQFWGNLIEEFPFILTIYYLISWLSLVGFLFSLFFIEGSRDIFTQFLWSFYVILQFFLLARSKTISWKIYIMFFLVGAWLITPFTALFVNTTHAIFGGETSDFWSSAILTPITEELFKLIPILVFLFISRRSSSLSLSDFMLVGAAVGAGFQLMEEAARRLNSGLIGYGKSLFGQYLNWDFFVLFPGYFKEEWFGTVMSSSHAVITALIALGIGIAIRLRSYINNFAFIIPALLYLLGTLDHAVWNGQSQMPEWIRSFHEMLGGGHATKPLLLMLLALVLIADYWVLHKQKDNLPKLTSESVINPFLEIYRLIHSFCVERDKYFYLLTFYRERRELGMILEFGNKETDRRKANLLEKMDRYYLPVLAFMAFFLIVTIALTETSLLYSNVDVCFACLFDSLQSWWDGLEGYEKGAIGLFAFALTFPLLGVWSGIGVATAAVGTMASGKSIAEIIRHPGKLASPEYAMSAMIFIGLSRIPGGGTIGRRVFKNSKGPDDAFEKMNEPRYGERKISSSLNRKLRSSSPTKKIQDDINKNIDDLMGTPDPALPGKTINGKLHADHIVPLAKITKMDGFDTLTYEQQKLIANHRNNFVGLTETANKSKGAKSFEEWTIYKKEGIPVDQEFREQMMVKEKGLEREIQNMIDEFNKLNGK